MSDGKDRHRPPDRQPDPPQEGPARDAGRPGPEPLGRTSTLDDTPSVRGMIAKVAHMVEVVE